MKQELSTQTAPPPDLRRKNVKNAGKRCAHPGCERDAFSKGVCGPHWKRDRRGTKSSRPIGVYPNSQEHYLWRGGLSKSADGRVLVRNPAGSSSPYILRSRLVMQNHLGRLLTSDEIVHHKNEVVTDDRIENLQLMTRATHAAHHLTINNPRKRK